MSNTVENNLMRSQLSPLNRILLRVSVQEDVQFRHFRDPATIGLAVELNGELHNHNLPPIERTPRLGKPGLRAAAFNASMHH